MTTNPGGQTLDRLTRHTCNAKPSPTNEPICGTLPMLEAAADDQPPADPQAGPPAALEGSSTKAPPEASPMAFDRKVATAEGKALVSDLVARLEAWEEQTGKRQRARRAKAQTDLVEAVGRTAGDLVASTDKGILRRVPCPKGANAFTPLPVGYRSFKAVYQALLGLWAPCSSSRARP